MNIPDYTLAYLGGTNPFNGDYIKYVEAIFSNKECKSYYPDGYSEDKKDELVNTFLSESNKYYDILQKEVNNLPCDGGIGIITNNISVFVGKIIDGIGIK